MIPHRVSATSLQRRMTRCSTRRSCSTGWSFATLAAHRWPARSKAAVCAGLHARQCAMSLSTCWTACRRPLEPDRAAISQTFDRLALRSSCYPARHAASLQRPRRPDVHRPRLAASAHWLFTRDHALLRLARRARERGVIVLRPADWQPSMTRQVEADERAPTEKAARRRPFDDTDARPVTRWFRPPPRPGSPAAPTPVPRLPAARSPGARRRPSPPSPCAPRGMPCRCRRESAGRR